MKTILTALFLGAALAGCASTQYPVHIVTNPPNALVACSGTPIGYAPTVGYWKKTDIENNRLQIDCRATWVSGAAADLRGYIDTVKFSDGVLLQIERPANAPNYSQDAQAAMYGAQQRENDRRLQRQQNRQEMQYLEEQLRNIGRTNNTNCYTVSNQVFCRSY